MRILPRAAWEAYLKDQDAAALLAVIAAQPERRPPAADYPEFHRLRDIDLAGRTYRVCRLVDLDDGEERLFIEPTDVPDVKSEGVPYRLQGQELRDWIHDEREYPSKGS